MNANLQIDKSAVIPQPDNVVNACSLQAFSSEEAVLLKWGIDTVYARQCLSSNNPGDSVPLICNSGTDSAGGIL
jgi:hypothetical protein